MNRPFFKNGLEQIKDFYLKNRSDSEAVKAVLFELSFRKTAGAKAFLASIEKHIQDSNGKSIATAPARTARPHTAATPKTPGPSKVLTQEQSQAIALFSKGTTLKVNAFAGTGKTSTLVEMARVANRSGLYLAFNKAISEEAKEKFPASVRCSTTHSLAFQAMKGLYRSCTKNKMIESLNGNAVAEILKLTKRVYKNFSLTEKQQGYLVLSTTKRFLFSDAAEINAEHFPRHGKLTSLEADERKALQSYVLEQAAVLWERMRSTTSDIPLGHDGYLKAWALGNPILPADFIMLDEAQDSNPAVLGVLKRQSSQVIYVGDRHQQIYEWRGAVNAMEKIPAEQEGHLTTSFRFGSTIAEEANKVLRRLGESRAMQGNPSVSSKLGCVDPHTIIARTNASLISSLIEFLQLGKKPAIVGGTQELLRLLRGVELLQSNIPCDVPEFFGFGSWSEVVEFAESEDGESLRTFVKLVSVHGVSRLFGFLRVAVDSEEKADIILTTTHKAKGREWDKVELLDDFVLPKIDREGRPVPLDPEEFRILYVAMTRGKKEVQLPDTVVSMLGSTQPKRVASVASSPRKQSIDSPSEPRSRLIESVSVSSDRAPSSIPALPQSTSFVGRVVQFFTGRGHG